LFITEEWKEWEEEEEAAHDDDVDDDETPRIITSQDIEDDKARRIPDNTSRIAAEPRGMTEDEFVRFIAEDRRVTEDEARHIIAETRARIITEEERRRIVAEALCMSAEEEALPKITFRQRDIAWPHELKEFSKFFNARLNKESIGRINTNGYRVINIEGREYYAHDLVYVYMTGEWPKVAIEHFNGNRDDNRWENLRLRRKEQNFGITEVADAHSLILQLQRR
jgi:hypothetical protein